MQDGDDDQSRRVTRRTAMAAGVTVASAVAVAQATGGGGPDPAAQQSAGGAEPPAGVSGTPAGGPGAERCAPSETRGPQPGPPGWGANRLPAVFVPHGGGPWPFVDFGLGDRAELDDLAAYLRSLRGVGKALPRALLVISAHWEEPVPTVMTAAAPPMLYDYYGFPPESYQITWPAPGQPQLAAQVRTLLAGAGFPTAANETRGFDHGTFVPLKVTFPEADVPTVQLSLVRGLDPRQHLAIGRALAPLRDQGVLIVGSGMSYHNLRAMGGARGTDQVFDAWLRASAVLEPAERDRRLIAWAQAPAARQAHPREEHLLPLMVVAGAAGADRGSVAWNGTFARTRLSAIHFG
jgi:aromatic ring-opening dioxygenase catalytic subunit (LigB family)